MRSSAAVLAALWLSAAPASAAGPACEVVRSSDAFLGALASRSLKPDALSALTNFDRDVARYLACLAVASGDDKPCADLGALDRAQKDLSPSKTLPVSYQCRIHSAVWRHDTARISHAPDLVARCVKENGSRLPGDGGPLKPGTQAVGCPILARYEPGGDAAAVCAELAPYFRYEGGMPVCIDLLHYVNGEDAAYCAHVRAPHTPARCLYLAAYRKAFDARDPKACGDDGLCRVQMGAGTQGCEPFRVELEKNVCHPEKPAI